MKVFIINIAESIERKKNVIKQLENLGITDFEIIPAIRGLTLSAEEVQNKYDRSKCLRRNGRELTPNEIGCSLSHRKVYQKIADTGTEKAIVLEDDVLIGPNFPEVLAMLEKYKTKNCIIKLDMYRPIRDIFSHRIHLNNKFIILHPLSEVQIAWGYYLDLKAAKSMLTVHTPIFTAADDWFFFRRFIKLRIMNVRIIQEAGLVSDIGYRPTPPQKNKSRLIKKIVRTYQDIVTWLH